MTRDMSRLNDTLSVTIKYRIAYLYPCSFVTDKLSDSLVIFWSSVTDKISVNLVISMVICDRYNIG
jgi:hypothetical protein